MSRWLAILPLIAILALGALFGLYALNRNPQVQPQALVGKAMPDSPRRASRIRRASFEGCGRNLCMRVNAFRPP